MKKKLIQLGLLGFPIGLAIGHVITLFISSFIADGLYYPVNQELIKTCGTELNAVLFQSLLCGIMGTCFSMASIIWHIDSWSIAKQTSIYFVISCIIMFPIAYYANWMPHSIMGILVHIGIFLIIFIFIWLSQYFIWKRKIRYMNEHINK